MVMMSVSYAAAAADDDDDDDDDGTSGDTANYSI